MSIEEDIKIRHESEEKFSDHTYSTKSKGPKHYSLNPTLHIYNAMIESLGDISGKRVLECGCGTGWVTFDLASRKAILDSFDISQVAVDRTRNLLEKYELAANSTVRKMSAEFLEYPDESFDIVIGFAILHHLDLDLAIPGLHRVMKPGGRALFAEPLGDNPLINLYRRLTPQFRTADEAPLRIREFEKRMSLFTNFSHREFYFTTMLAFMLSYIPWAKEHYMRITNPLMQLDEYLFRLFPALGNLAWYSIFTFEK